MNRSWLSVWLALLAAVGLDGLGAVLTLRALRASGQLLYTGHDPNWLRVAVPLAGSYLISGAGAWLTGTAGMIVSCRLRRSTLRRTLLVDPDVSRQFGPGVAQGIALDAELVGSLLVSAGPGTVLGAAQAVVGLVVLLRGTLAAPAVLLTFVVIGLITGAALRQARRRAAWTTTRAELTDALTQRLLGLRTISVQDDPATAETTGHRLLTGYRKASSRLDAATLLLIGSAFVVSAAYLLLAAASHQPEIARATDIGAALVTGLGFGQLCVGAADAVNAHDAYRQLTRLDDWRNRMPAPAPAVSAGPALVELREASYRYPAGGGLAEPTSLTVRPGDRLLVTGESGAGKTTLGELIAGRRFPDAGVLAVRPGARIGRVLQAGDDYIFHNSLIFNVLCGSQWPPTGADVRRAQQLLVELGLGPLLERMPNGFAQPVGEGGWRLSAGEAARISLARALQAEPDLLVLDETTAPLDPANRQLVLAVAERHANALLVIAHP